MVGSQRLPSRRTMLAPLPPEHRAGRAAGSPLPEPASHIQPSEYQSRPRGHEADAQRLASLAHAVERQSDPHHDEAG